MSEYNLGTARGAIRIDGSAAEVGFGVAQSAAQGFFKSIEYRIQGIQTLGKRLAAVGASGTVGFGAAVKVAADFEQQMSGVQAVANLTAKELDLVREKALQLGAETSFSAGEAAAGIEELAKAGLSVQDILGGAADAATLLAAAGGIELAQSAGIITAAMAAFNIEASKTPQIADLLAAAANASRADVDVLGQSLSQVAAVANLAGFSLEDTVVALGQMADAGIEGSDAGTALKTMFLNLIPSTDRQIDKFKEMNLLTYNSEKAMSVLKKKGIAPLGKSYEDTSDAVEKYLIKTKGLKDGTQKLKDEVGKFLIKNGAMQNQFFDQEGNVKSLAEVQKVLGKSTKNLTSEQKLASLEVLFGTDAMRGAAIMAQQGAKGYDEFTGKMEGITAADVAATRLDNLKGSAEELQGALETLMIKVGTPLLGALQKLTDVAANVVTRIGQLPQPILTTISVLGALASVFLLVVGIGLALVPVILGLAANMAALFVVRQVTRPFFAFGNVLLKTRSAATAMAAGQAALQKSIIRTTVVGKLMAVTLRVIGVAMRFAMGPFGIALAIIALLVAAFVLLYKKNENFRRIVDKVAAVVKGALGSALSWIVAMFQKLGPVLSSVGEWLQNLWGKMKAKGFEILVASGQKLIQFFNKLKEVFAPVIEEVQGSLMPALSELGATLKEVFGGMASNAASAFSSFMAAAAPVVGWIVSNIVPAIVQWYSILFKVYSFIAQVFVAVLVTQFQILMAVFKVVFAVIVAVLSTVIPIVLKIASIFMGVFVTAIVNAIRTVVGVISGIVKIITGVINVIAGIITGDWGRVWQGFKQIASGAIKVLGSIIRGGIGIARNAVKGIVNAITSTVDALPGLMRAAGEKLMNAFGEGIRAAGDAVIGKARAIANKIKDLVPGSPVKTGPLRSFNKGGAGRKLMGMLASGIEKGGGTAVDAMRRVAGAIGAESLEPVLAATATYDATVGSSNASVAAARTSAGVVTPAAAVADDSSSSTGLRFVSGTMSTDRGFDVYISGVAEEVDDSNSDFEDLMDRTA